MTEQEKDREKVIKGLECHAKMIGCRKRCPYWHIEMLDCSIKLADDAFALLKAQEPRVMTLSGVRNLKESTPVWLEDVDKKDVIGALFMQDYSGTKCVDFVIVRNWEHECVTAGYMDYGVRWRVWTFCPTDEQREETPWN